MNISRSREVYREAKNAYTKNQAVGRGFINPITHIPDHCKIVDLEVNDKKIKLIGIFHVQDCPISEKIDYLRKWLSTQIRNAPTNSNIFLEIPEDGLEKIKVDTIKRNQAGEMGMAVEAARQDCTLHSLEPNTKEELLRRKDDWLINEEGKQIQADNESTPPTYRGYTADQILTAYKECSLIFRGRPTTQKNIEIAKEFIPGFDHLFEPINSSIATNQSELESFLKQYPSSKDALKILQWPKHACEQKEHPVTLFNRISEIEMNIRDQYWVNKVMESDAVNCFIICGAGHVETLPKKFNIY